jgi:hypothetical protein
LSQIFDNTHLSTISIEGTIVIIYRYHDKLMHEELIIYFEQEESKDQHFLGSLKDFGFDLKLGAPLAMKHDPNYVDNPNENTIYTDKMKLPKCS